MNAVYMLQQCPCVFNLSNYMQTLAYVINQNISF